MLLKYFQFLQQKKSIVFCFRWILPQVFKQRYSRNINYCKYGYVYICVSFIMASYPFLRIRHFSIKVTVRDGLCKSFKNMQYVKISILKHSQSLWCDNDVHGCQNVQFSLITISKSALFNRSNLRLKIVKKAVDVGRYDERHKV